MKPRFYALFALLISLPSIAFAQTPLNNSEQRPAPPPKNPCAYFQDWSLRVSAEFGAYRSDTIVPADEIPLKAGQQYGYLFRVDGISTPVQIKEILIAPRPIPNWKNHKHEMELTISDDSQSSTSISTTKPGETFYEMYTYWTVALPDDPDGIYKSQIYVNDKLACAAEFNLVKPK